METGNRAQVSLSRPASAAQCLWVSTPGCFPLWFSFAFLVAVLTSHTHYSLGWLLQDVQE